MEGPNIRLVVVLTVALTGLGPLCAAPEPAQRSWVPSYWNPDAPPEKPDTAGIGAIRFVTTDDYPPFGFALQDGTPAGFEVDLARALCDELQVTCTIQARAWGTILPALADNQADAAIASMAIPDGVEQGVAFTRPYYKTPARFVVRLGTEFDASVAWKGQHVGVLEGTAHEAYLKRFFPDAVLARFASAQTLRSALKSGAIDTMFTDAEGASVWLNGSDAGGCCAFAGGAYTEERYFGRGAGIAVRTKDVMLRRALDYALARVAAKGLYGDIYLRYFPLGLY